MQAPKRQAYGPNNAKGTTPIPFVLTLSKDDPLKVRFRAELTKSALEDLRARRQRSYRHYP